MRNADAKTAGGEATTQGAQAVRSGLRTAARGTSELGGRLRGWRDTAMRETRERPGRSAALAIGAGYVLGGGLLSALTARFLAFGIRAGLRLAVVPLVTQTLSSMGEGLFSPDSAATEQDSADLSQSRSEGRNGRRQSEHKETNP